MPYTDKDKGREQRRKWREANRDRVNAYQRRWHAANRERGSAYTRKHVYGLSNKQYEELLNAQRGVCAVCGKAETRKTRSGFTSPLCVDHCHKTNQVRGLLCYSCNLALGHVQDDPELLRKLADYLE